MRAVLRLILMVLFIVSSSTSTSVAAVKPAEKKVKLVGNALAAAVVKALIQERWQEIDISKKSYNTTGFKFFNGSFNVSANFGLEKNAKFTVFKWSDNSKVGEYSLSRAELSKLISDKKAEFEKKHPLATTTPPATATTTTSATIPTKTVEPVQFVMQGSTGSGQAATTPPAANETVGAETEVKEQAEPAPAQVSQQLVAVGEGENVPSLVSYPETKKGQNKKPQYQVVPHELGLVGAEPAKSAAAPAVAPTKPWYQRLASYGAARIRSAVDYYFRSYTPKFVADEEEYTQAPGPKPARQVPTERAPEPVTTDLPSKLITTTTTTAETSATEAAPEQEAVYVTEPEETSIAKAKAQWSKEFFTKLVRYLPDIETELYKVIGYDNQFNPIRLVERDQDLDILKKTNVDAYSKALAAKTRLAYALQECLFKTELLLLKKFEHYIRHYPISESGYPEVESQSMVISGYNNPKDIRKTVVRAIIKLVNEKNEDKTRRAKHPVYKIQVQRDINEALKSVFVMPNDIKFIQMLNDQHRFYPQNRYWIYLYINLKLDMWLGPLEEAAVEEEVVEAQKAQSETNLTNEQKIEAATLLALRNKFNNKELDEILEKNLSEMSEGAVVGGRETSQQGALPAVPQPSVQYALQATRPEVQTATNENLGNLKKSIDALKVQKRFKIEKVSQKISKGEPFGIGIYYWVSKNDPESDVWTVSDKNTKNQLFTVLTNELRMVLDLPIPAVEQLKREATTEKESLQSKKQNMEEAIFSAIKEAGPNAAQTILTDITKNEHTQFTIKNYIFTKIENTDLWEVSIDKSAVLITLKTSEVEGMLDTVAKPSQPPTTTTTTTTATTKTTAQ